MKNCKCIFSQAFYYAVIYLLLVLIAFGIGFINNIFAWDFEVLNVIGFGALVFPTVPFQGLLLNNDLMINAGGMIIPSDGGLLLAHGIWFTFFYVTYLSFLLFKKKCCSNKK
ncbi:MAG: hypothetical protein ACI9TY_000283 [Alphaproteobacteria bacterium]|jgi:hypothetical protein